MRPRRTASGLLAAASFVPGLLACSSGVSLLGDQDVDAVGHDDTRETDVAGDAPPDPDTSADADAGPEGDAAGDGDADPDGGTDSGADGDPDRSADADADALDAPPDGPIARLVPDETETYFDYGDSGRVGMHRHAFPAAWSGAAYVVLLEDRGDDWETPGPIALFRFERGTEGLHEVWVDDAADVTEYNSVCWTGEAFVAVLPTVDVGLRVLAVDAAGAVLRPPEVLGSDSTYVPAGHGEPPVLLCPGSGAFVLDPGQGAGGLDRLYAVAPDGAVSGEFVDADIPTFARNLYFTPVPCAVSGDDAACATENGLAFVRGDGSARASDPLSGAPACGGPDGCDLAAAGPDLFLLGLLPSIWPEAELVLARWSSDGRLALPMVAVATTEGAGPEPSRLRASSSGSTALAVAFGGMHDIRASGAMLIGRDGAPMDLLLPLATCSFLGGPACMDHAYADGGAVVWEGDAYAVLWITSRGVAYRRLGVAW
ncbi:MAG: hypothetical protein HY907_03355 [Deltaproteobacteria bacterium]|nr:hypothetical protein [Deltaproteobacteria bacterium]